MKIKAYVKPGDLSEAYAHLIETKKAVVLGGGMFLRLQKRTFPLAIDLSDLGLDRIECSDGVVRLGAMTSLRAIECSDVLPEALVSSVRQVAGVSVRNMATIGGSVMGRYPFSDVITPLLALDAVLHFYEAGPVSLKAFLKEGLKTQDLLTEVSFEMPHQSAFKAIKSVYTDFSMVNLALVKGGAFCLSVGARPMRAESQLFPELLAPEVMLSGFDFKSDQKASGAYRLALATACLEDVIKEAALWK